MPSALEPEQARFRLFDSITTFLKNASTRKPMVLVLDDLHWGDKPSLLMLQVLGEAAARIAAAGAGDVSGRGVAPRASSIADAGRAGPRGAEPAHHPAWLDGARRGAVHRDYFGVVPPTALVEAVHRETEGNPFFVNEIVRLLVADGRLEKAEATASWSVTIPQSVREVVGRRLDHLSETCNDVLTVASVIGREFDLTVLGRVSELPGDRLLDVLDEAVAARVISEVPSRRGQYAFTHALIRETLYEELSTPRRVRLHRQTGEALEKMQPPDPDAQLPQLAYHFFEAAQDGEVDKAINYAQRAAQRATGLFAHGEAVAQCEQSVAASGAKRQRWRRGAPRNACSTSERRSGAPVKPTSMCRHSRPLFNWPGRRMTQCSSPAPRWVYAIGF